MCCFQTAPGPGHHALTYHIHMAELVSKEDKMPKAPVHLSNPSLPGFLTYYFIQKRFCNKTELICSGSNALNLSQNKSFGSFTNSWLHLATKELIS